MKDEIATITVCTMVVLVIAIAAYLDNQSNERIHEETLAKISLQRDSINSTRNTK